MPSRLDHHLKAIGSHEKHGKRTHGLQISDHVGARAVRRAQNAYDFVWKQVHHKRHQKRTCPHHKSILREGFVRGLLFAPANMDGAYR